MNERETLNLACRIRRHLTRQSFHRQRQQKRTARGERRNIVDRLYPHVRFGIVKGALEDPNVVSLSCCLRILANPGDLGAACQRQVAGSFEPPVINVPAIDDVQASRWFHPHNAATERTPRVGRPSLGRFREADGVDGKSDTPECLRRTRGRDCSSG